MAKRHLVGLVWFAAILAACSRPTAQVDPDPSGPNTPAILCRALGKDPATDQLCDYSGDDEQLKMLILSAFPPGMATESDVRAHLGIYFLSEDKTSSKVQYEETYAIEQPVFFLPGPPKMAIFIFDAQGILQDVIIQKPLS